MGTEYRRGGATQDGGRAAGRSQDGVLGEAPGDQDRDRFHGGCLLERVGGGVLAPLGAGFYTRVFDPLWDAPGCHQIDSEGHRALEVQAWFKTGYHPVLNHAILFRGGGQALPRIGRDTRPPSPRRLTGAGRLRRLFVVRGAYQGVTRLAPRLNHAEVHISRPRGKDDAERARYGSALAWMSKSRQETSRKILEEPKRRGASVAVVSASPTFPPRGRGAGEQRPAWLPSEDLGERTPLGRRSSSFDALRGLLGVVAGTTGSGPPGARAPRGGRIRDRLDKYITIWQRQSKAKRGCHLSGEERGASRGAAGLGRSQLPLWRED